MSNKISKLTFRKIASTTVGLEIITEVVAQSLTYSTDFMDSGIVVTLFEIVVKIIT